MNCCHYCLGGNADVNAIEIPNYSRFLIIWYTGAIVNWDFRLFEGF